MLAAIPSFAEGAVEAVRWIQQEVSRQQESDDSSARGDGNTEEENASLTSLPFVIQSLGPQYNDYSVVAPDEEEGTVGPFADNDPTGDTHFGNFPTKLHCILSRRDLSHIVSWLPHGRAWRVHRPADFVKIVAPQYFHLSKFASFTRQVNGWGFRRIGGAGKDAAGYYHELFLRGMPHLLRRMRRPTLSSLSSSSSSKKNKVHNAATSASTSCLFKIDIAPNFYEMSQARPLPLKNPTGYKYNQQSSRQLPVPRAASSLTPIHLLPQQQQSLSCNFHNMAIAIELVLRQRLLMANKTLSLQLLKQKQQKVESLSSAVNSTTTRTGTLPPNLQSSKAMLNSKVNIKREGGNPIDTNLKNNENQQQRQEVERKQEEWEGRRGEAPALTLESLVKRQQELLTTQRNLMRQIQSQGGSGSSSSSPLSDALLLDDDRLFFAETTMLSGNTTKHEYAGSSISDLKIDFDQDQLEEMDNMDDLLI